MDDIGIPGGNYSFAGDINDRGQVVGSSNSFADPSQVAFLWQDGVGIKLESLGGIISGASRINERGQIVGYSQTANGEFHAVLWTK
jgi:probable HAF family extracellular repeat protein